MIMQTKSIKPIYLMAGGRRSHKGGDPVIQAIIKDIGVDVPTIAYVGAASEDDPGFFKMISQMIQNSADCRFTHALMVSAKADINKAKESLQSADAVFMSGGDVEAGMQVLRDKKLISFFKEVHNSGKLFFGASAGSIMMAREWVRWPDPDDDSSAELFPCLGLAPLIIDTHAEEDNWSELKAALHLKDQLTTGYGIASGSTLKISPGGLLEALGGPVAVYQGDIKKVKQQADQLPNSI
jgi:peptidase E